MKKKKPTDGSKPDNTVKNPFSIKSEADQAWWDRVMEQKGWNLYTQYGKDDMRAFSLYVQLEDH